MIELRKLSKGFGKKTVIRDVSTVFETGKCNLIIGASGSGKTVLMKCIVGLFEPDEGEVLYEGQNFTHMREEKRKELRQQIGMLFQGSALFDSMTVEQNVRFPLDMFTKQSLREKSERVMEVLERVNLTEAAKKYPSEISGGMKKRVGIARAIVLNPKYLFCDEPNSGLDPLTAVKIDLLIQEITKEFNITTIVISHDMNSVMRLAEYIIFLKDGKKVWEGNNQNLLQTEVPSLQEFLSTKLT